MDRILVTNFDLGVLRRDRPIWQYRTLTLFWEESTTECNIGQKESAEVAMKMKDVQRTVLQCYEQCEEKEQSDPKVEALVTELIGRVADKSEEHTSELQ